MYAYLLPFSEINYRKLLMKTVSLRATLGMKFMEKTDVRLNSCSTQRFLNTASHRYQNQPIVQFMTI